MTTSLATRFAVARASGVVQPLSGSKLRPLDSTRIPGVVIGATDLEWGRLALEDERVGRAVRQIIADLPEGAPFILSLRPGALVLSNTRPDHDAIDAALLRAWAGSMRELLDALEALPPPAHELPRTQIEVAADDPDRTQRLVLIGMVVFSIAVTAFVVAAVLLFLLLVPRP